MERTGRRAFRIFGKSGGGSPRVPIFAALPTAKAMILAAKAALPAAKASALASTALVLAALFVPPPALAASPPDVVVGADPQSAYPGETVQVPIRITAPSEAIYAYGLRIDFPADVLQVTGVEGGLRPLTADDWNADNAAGWLRVAWIDESLANPIGDEGVLLVVSYQVGEDAPAGMVEWRVGGNADGPEFAGFAANPLAAETSAAVYPFTVREPPDPDDDAEPDAESAAGIDGESPPVTVGEQTIVTIDAERDTSGQSLVDTVEFGAASASAVVREALRGGAKTARLIVAQTAETPADEISLTITAAALSELGNAEIGLAVEAEGVALTIPGETIRGLGLEEDLQIRIAPIRDETARLEVRNAVLASQTLRDYAQGRPVETLGFPIRIEVGYSGQTTGLLLPLGGVPLPENPDEREAYLARLAVFIEHGDGEQAIKQGTIRYDDNGGAAGIEIEVDKFSTFTLIAVAENDAAPPYMSGFPDGTFRPDAELTRAQLATMLDRTAGMDDAAMDLAGAHADRTPPLADVAETHWAHDAIALVKARGWMTGGDDGKFRPDEGVTRAEMAAIAARLQNLGAYLIAPEAPYSDTQAHRAAEAIALVTDAGMMSGYPDGSFRPDVGLKRAEAVIVLNRMFGISPARDDGNEGTGGEHGTDKVDTRPAWPDVPPAHWAYPDIMAATGRY